MRTLILPLAALLVLARIAAAQGAEAPTKEALYRDLDAEHRQYDKTVKDLQAELKTVVKAVKSVLEPEGKPAGNLDVTPRTPEQEKTLADAQAQAGVLVDKMLDEEMRHRQRVLELLNSGRGLLRAELTSLIAAGKVPTGTLRDLLLPAGEQPVQVPTDADDAKKKSLFDQKDDEDESLE